MPYIFGYGSLIEQASRLRSTPSALYVLPARARGYARGWWARTGAIGFSTTFVGAIPEKSSYMNGVIYAVNKEELDDTDKRESGYTREDIASHLEILLMGVAERRASSCEKNLIPFCLTRSFVEAGDYRSRELFTLEGA